MITCPDCGNFLLADGYCLSCQRTTFIAGRDKQTMTPYPAAPFTSQEWEQLEDLLTRAQRCVDLQAHAQRKYHLDTAEHGLMRVPADLLHRMLKEFRAPKWDLESVKRELVTGGEVRVPAALVVDLLQRTVQIRRFLDRWMQELSLDRLIQELMENKSITDEFIPMHPCSLHYLPPGIRSPKMEITPDGIVSTDFYFNVPKNLKGAKATATYCDEAGDIGAAEKLLARESAKIKTLGKGSVW